MLWTDGRIGLRLLAGRLLEVALRLENVHHRLDGGVGDGAPLAERVVNVAHSGVAERPDDFHDLELLPGQRFRLGTHTNYLVLSNSSLSSRRISNRRRAWLVVEWRGERLCLGCGPRRPGGRADLPVRDRRVLAQFASLPVCAGPGRGQDARHHA